MTDPASKIIKRDGEITDLEHQVARTLSELELSNAELKQDIRDVYITGATNFRETGSGSKQEALIIMILYRSMAATRRVHSDLIKELEKRFKKTVVIIFQRKILPKYLKKKGEQKRPFSRTLTSVHEEILNDLIFPTSILGKRIRIKGNGRRLIKIFLDPQDREAMEDKLDTLQDVYKKLTNKEVQFLFPESREFPIQPNILQAYKMECPVCLNSWNSEYFIPRILVCGHSLCEVCGLQLLRESQLTCPTCQTLHQFTVSMSDVDYQMKCIQSMTKNFTLLSLVSTRPTVQQKPITRQISGPMNFKIGEMCNEHGLLIHSYTEKPYSLVCSNCIEEISHYNLSIKPIPNVVNYLQSALKKINLSLNRKAQSAQFNKDIDYSNEIKKLDGHFDKLKRELNDIHIEASQYVEQAIIKKQKAKDNQLAGLMQHQKNIQQIEYKLQTLQIMQDNQIVSYLHETKRLVKRAQNPLKQSPNNNHNLQLSINRACYEALRELIMQSYEIIIEENQNVNFN